MITDFTIAAKAAVDVRATLFPLWSRVEQTSRVVWDPSSVVVCHSSPL